MTKEGSKNPMQKGTRRQKLNENQNNVGNDKNVTEYTDFNGSSIK
ncbi:clostri-philic family protein [Clostridium sp.]|nr:clostri-philic family protein [Clostridium sp.]